VTWRFLFQCAARSHPDGCGLDSSTLRAVENTHFFLSKSAVEKKKIALYQWNKIVFCISGAKVSTGGFASFLSRGIFFNTWIHPPLKVQLIPHNKKELQ
jgi:hypothetical protein